MPDFQPSSPKDVNESSATSMRSSLMSSGTTSASSHGTSVNVPGQNQRHSIADRNSVGSSSFGIGHHRSNPKPGVNSDNSLHTIANVAVAQMDHSGDSPNKNNTTSAHSLSKKPLSSKPLHSSGSKVNNYSMVSMMPPYHPSSDSSKGSSERRLSLIHI